MAVVPWNVTQHILVDKYRHFGKVVLSPSYTRLTLFEALYRHLARGTEEKL